MFFVQLVREDAKMVPYVGSRTAKSSTRTVVSPVHLDETKAPSGCVHVRAFVRSLRPNTGLAEVIPISENRLGKGYDKKNGNVYERLSDGVSLFVPIGVNYRQALDQMTRQFPDFFRFTYRDDGVTVRVPAGTEVVVYRTFNHPSRWDMGESRCVATFFLDGGRLQLTVKTDGKIYYRTPRSQRDL